MTFKSLKDGKRHEQSLPLPVLFPLPFSQNMYILLTSKSSQLASMRYCCSPDWFV